MDLERSSRVGFLSFVAVTAALSSLAGRPASADVRSDATRIQYLLDKKHCSSSSNCRNPTGKQVDHIVPLWAGGADHPSNMQLLSDDDHQRKTASERQIQTQMLTAVRAGQEPVLRAPTEGYWSGGKWAGTLVRAFDDGRVLVRLDISRQFGDIEAGRVAVLVAVPLAGLTEAPSDMRNGVQKFMRRHVNQQLLVSPQGSLDLALVPARLARAPFGGAGNFPSAIVNLRSEPAEAKSINVQIAAEGLARVAGTAAKDLGKRTARELMAAQTLAKKAGRNAWAAEAAAALARENSDREERKRKKERSSNSGWASDDSSESGGGGGQGGGSGRVQVRGYSRSDGTYVAPHSRSAPSGHSGNSGSFGLGGGRRR